MLLKDTVTRRTTTREKPEAAKRDNKITSNIIIKKGRKYDGGSNFHFRTTKRRRVVTGRRSSTAGDNTHVFCKVIVLTIILEGLGGGFGGVRAIASIEGNSGNDWQLSRYQQRQQQPSSFAGDWREEDIPGNGDSFIRSFAGDRMGAARRMRDRCGRYSLFKVLQQWENLQRRCRLRVRKILNNNDHGNNDSVSNRQYYEENDAAADPFEYMVAPPSPSEHDSLEEVIRNGYRNVKRSRYPVYTTFGKDETNQDENVNEFRNYYYEVNGDALETCCPVVFEVIAPIYGRNRSGHMVELYKDGNVQQKFNEYRCHKDYLDKPCRFMDSQYRRISKCMQQYLDTYALVRSDTSTTGWSMEHIRVASGCACKVDPTSSGRRRKKVLAGTDIAQPPKNQREESDDALKWYNFGRGLNKKNSKKQSFHQLLHTSSGFSDY